MSESVRVGLLALLHSGTHADVLIRFHLERTPEEQQPTQQQLGPEAEGAKGQNAAGDLHFLGDTLQAHKAILTLGSTYLEARLQGAGWQGATAGAPHASHAAEERSDRHRGKRPKLDAASQQSSEGGQQGLLSTGVSALPEVLVPLSSEAEEPFARQAIEFIYTGSLSTDLSFEALLRLRQQACYLGVKHCPQACDQAMLAWLAAPHEDKPLQQQQDGADVHSTSAAEPRVLQAYSCRGLFPQPGTSPDAASFQPVRSALAKQLVSHFGDAVAALTRPDLYRQLLQLPAVSLEELLAADDFGTDSEDSVFLMLACWLEANKGKEGEQGVSAATRAELCGLVRLHRLRPLYLNFVLPVYEPFNILSRAELGCVLRFAGAVEQEKKQLLDLGNLRQTSPWYCSPARRQVVPDKGRTFEWSISREQLEQELRQMVEDKEEVQVLACVGASAAAVGCGSGSARSRVLSHGGLWGLQLQLDPTKPGAVGIYVSLTVPQQLGKIQGAAALTHVEVAVHSWAQGKRKAGWSGKFTAGDVIKTTCGYGWHKTLTLPPAAASGAGGEGSAAGGVEAEVAAQLARWSRWLHEGKITGSITFPRH